MTLGNLSEEAAKSFVYGGYGWVLFLRPAVRACTLISPFGST